MIYYLLLLASIALAVCKSSVYNAYAKNTSPSLFSTFGFNAVTYGVAAAIALVTMIFGNKALSLSTFLCAIVYAATVFSLQTLSVRAMTVGAMSMTSICVMYGMIIPSLAGPIFWSESIGILQIFGIVLMVVSLWLLNGIKANGGEKVSKKWIPLAALCFLLSGMAGVIEKIHQSTDGRAEKNTFVFIACVLMLIFSLAASLITKSKSTDFSPKPIIIFGATSGIIVGFYSTVNLTLAGALDSMIYYPVANGGAMLLTVLVARVIFKEKLDVLKITGFAVGLCGIICLSIPI